MSNLVTIQKQLLDPRSLTQFKMSLPAHIPPERFQRAALTALRYSPDLGECSPQSVMNALLKCAQDGLIPDAKEAAIVKFKGQAQYMPMVYGIIKRMRNSGEVLRVNAYNVYANDVFDYEINNGVETLRHKPALTGNRGEFLLSYCVIDLKDSDPHIEVMMKDEIMKAKNAGLGDKSPAWRNWEGEMAKKTVIHRAAKRVPTTSDVEKFLAADMRMMLNVPEPTDSMTLVDSINASLDVLPETQVPPMDDSVIDQPQDQQQQQQPVVQQSEVLEDRAQANAPAPQQQAQPPVSNDPPGKLDNMPPLFND